MESFQDFLLTEVADYEAYLKKYANSKSKKKLMTRTDFNTWKKHNEYWKSLPKKNGIVTGPAPDKAKKKVAEEVEQIDELEKKTVISYLNKADPSQGMRNAEKETPGILKNPNALRQYKKKVKAGVSRALDRLKPKQGMAEAAQIGVGSKVYHPIHGSGKVLKHSTGAGADHWAEVKFLSGNTKRVNRKHLKLEEVVAEGLKPGWMLKQDPKLAAKVKAKIDLAKKRQASYGDPSKGKSVSEETDIETKYKKIADKHMHVALAKLSTPANKDYARKMHKRAMQASKMTDADAAHKHYMGVKEEVVAEGAVDHSALGKHHEKMTDQELRKVGSKLPNSWDAAAFRRKLASHPKYAQALKHYDKSEYHFGKAARQANKKVTEGMDYSVTVKHTKDGKTLDHEYTVKNANDKRHAKNIALQRHEKKIGGLKDGEQISASSNHVKELRNEEVHINEALDPSEIAGNPKMYDAATVKKAFYHKNASESDKQSLARHLDRHHGNKEWHKSVKEESELCPKCGMSPCQCDGFAEQKETNMSISFKDFVNMLEEAKCKMKEAEEIETSDYKTDKNGRKHRAHKIVFNKGESKREDDEDDMKEELKGNQHKLDKNKNGKLDAHDFKLLRKEEQELDEAETIKKDGVTRHKGDYGTSYDGDDNKKPAPTVKRGRGRPKKGSDETGEVKKFDFSALIQKHKIPKFTGKSTVHKMKD